MARRRYSRAAKALTQLSRTKSMGRRAEFNRQSEREGTAHDIARMNKAYAFAGQALVTADKMVQERKTKAKIEKGVTSLAEQKGGEVSYKKTRLRDIWRGEGKLKDLGKESWNIGGTDYDRADVLAWEAKTQKDLKWEGVIGTDLDGDEKVTKLQKKDYTVAGDVMKKDKYGQDMKESEFGKGWSYDKQKKITRLQDKQYRADWHENRKKVNQNIGTKHGATLNKALITEGKEVADNDGNIDGVSVAKTDKQNKLMYGKAKNDASKNGSDLSDKIEGIEPSAKSVRNFMGKREGIDILENWKDKIKAKKDKKIADAQGVVDLDAARQSLVDQRMTERSTDKSMFGEDDYEQSTWKQSLENIEKRYGSADEHMVSSGNFSTPTQDGTNIPPITVPSIEGATSMDSGYDFTTEGGYTLAGDFSNKDTRVVHHGKGTPEGFDYSGESNIALLNTYIRDQMPESSSLSQTWDFNKAYAGKYDTTNVKLKGLEMKDMWSALGIGNKWKDRPSMYKMYQEKGYF